GHILPLTLNDILIVAPYNNQVGRLRAALAPGARVGTVDKFQGQEAPVVIYSMTSSSAQDAPRGIEFLYDLHRLTVAVSPAKALNVCLTHRRHLDCDEAEARELVEGQLGRLLEHSPAAATRHGQLARGPGGRDIAHEVLIREERPVSSDVGHPDPVGKPQQ